MLWDGKKNLAMSPVVAYGIYIFISVLAVVVIGAGIYDYVFNGNECGRRDYLHRLRGWSTANLVRNLNVPVVYGT